ncbi:MAG TPA: SIS domain-containing protein [Thermotoga sp.]|nr:SIS domain-containing protein [Thermotoga sp.]
MEIFLTSVICITEHANSPLARKSDVVIETFSGENPIRTSAGRSILAQIFAIEILSAFLYLLEPDLAVKAGEETAKAVVNKLY